MEHLIITPNNYTEVLGKFGEIVPSGSYFISGVQDTDIDFFMEHDDALISHIKELGFSTENSKEYSEGLISYARDKINIILVKKGYLPVIKLATDLCIYLKVKEKHERLAVSNAIEYGVVQGTKYKPEITL